MGVDPDHLLEFLQGRRGCRTARGRLRLRVPNNRQHQNPTADLDHDGPCVGQRRRKRKLRRCDQIDRRPVGGELAEAARRECHADQSATSDGRTTRGIHEGLHCQDELDGDAAVGLDRHAAIPHRPAIPAGRSGVALRRSVSDPAARSASFPTCVCFDRFCGQGPASGFN